MLKLYRFSENAKDYWETWDNGDGSHTVHWGELGTRGKHKKVKSSVLKSAEKKVRAEANQMKSTGYHEIDLEDHHLLLIEFEVNGMGNVEDINKRHRLEDRMNETLGWTGMGHCDGGSIGSGTTEACNFVVDFDLAKQVVEQDLAGTEFADYSRIYEER